MTARTREKRRRRKALVQWRCERFRREFGRMAKRAYGDGFRDLFGIPQGSILVGTFWSPVSAEAASTAWLSRAERRAIGART